MHTVQPAVFPVSRLFCFIWFNTANVMRRAFHQRVNELVGLSLNTTQQHFIDTHTTGIHRRQLQTVSKNS